MSTDSADPPTQDEGPSFDHIFSGYSVWLEPQLDDAALFRSAMADLSRKCGGPSRGCHEFEPHCTLLYNIKTLPRQRRLIFGSNDDKLEEEDEGEAGERLLRECLREFRRSMADADADGDDNSKRDCPSEVESTAKEPLAHILQLKAMSHYYFPYPIDADEGLGFGCLIPLLLLDKTPGLQALHGATAAVFPSDERHRRAGGTFRPHMALVYAPESERWLEKWTAEAASTAVEGRGLLGGMRAGCLSVWKTKGTIDEWRQVAKVDLS